MFNKLIEKRRRGTEIEFNEGGMGGSTIIEVNPEVKALRNQVSMLTKRNLAQTEEIRRLQAINTGRKEAIKGLARLRDEFKQYVMYAEGIFDAHNVNRRWFFDFGDIFNNFYKETTGRNLTDKRGSLT